MNKLDGLFANLYGKDALGELTRLVRGGIVIDALSKEELEVATSNLHLLENEEMGYIAETLRFVIEARTHRVFTAKDVARILLATFSTQYAGAFAVEAGKGELLEKAQYQGELKYNGLEFNSFLAKVAQRPGVYEFIGRLDHLMWGRVA